MTSEFFDRPKLIFTISYKTSFRILNNMVLMVVRQEIKSNDSSVVVHELKFATNRVLYHGIL